MSSDVVVNEYSFDCPLFSCYNCDMTIYELSDNDEHGDEGYVDFSLLVNRFQTERGVVTVDDEKGRKVLFCSSDCKHQFDFDNNDYIIRNVLYDVIYEEEGKLYHEMYPSRRILLENENDLKSRGVKILWISPNKVTYEESEYYNPKYFWRFYEQTSESLNSYGIER